MISSIVQGYEPSICVKAGLLAAEYSISCQDAISPSVNPHNFTPESIEMYAPFTPQVIDVSHVR